MHSKNNDNSLYPTDHKNTVTQLVYCFYGAKAVLTQVCCPNVRYKPGSYHCIGTKTFMALHWAVEDLKGIPAEILGPLHLRYSLEQLFGGVCTSRRGGFGWPVILHVVFEHMNIQICNIVVIYIEMTRKVVCNEKKCASNFCTNDHAMPVSPATMFVLMLGLVQGSLS